MMNFYKGGRGLAFSQREGGASSRKEKPPRLTKILTNQVEEEGTEGHPNSTRRNRLVFYRFFDLLKVRIKYRCSNDVVLFTQLLRKIAEVPLMYRECTVSVRGVYRKGTGDLLRSYWRSTKDPLDACTSGVDQRYSKSRRVEGVEATKNKSMPFVLVLIWFSRRLFSLMALKNIRILCLGFLCFMLFNLSEAWAQSAESRTAEGQIEIKPLQIGDTIPEAIWNMPLQTVKHGRETKEIRLGDYRGKVIILDYWATWCAGCILSMPKMHKLAEEMGDEVALLAVTRQDEQIVSRYLKVTTSKQIKKLRDSFSTIVSGNALADLIPHRSLPHIAIINKHGVLEQTTLPHLLNTSILQSIATGNDYYLPVMRLDVDTTLLSQTFPDIRHDKPIYYATLMGYVDGFAAPSKHSVDSLANITRGYFINTSILRVMNIALQSKGVGLLPNRRIMLVDKPASYDYFHERNPDYQRREFSVSYEYAFPINWSRKRINSRILSDIQDYRSLYGK